MNLQIYKEEDTYRKEINNVLEYYGKKDGHYTKYSEVGDNWEYIDNIVAEVVKNIKAKKKAAAAAKRAARELY